MEEHRSPTGLTPTQQRLFDTLADGQWHQRDALLLAITGKRHASVPAVSVHVHRLRPKIEPWGYRIEGNHSPKRGGWRMNRIQPAA